MIIPESITNVIPKNPFDNVYFYHAKDAMSRLDEIDKQKSNFTMMTIHY